MCWFEPNQTVVHKCMTFYYLLMSDAENNKMITDSGCSNIPILLWGLYDAQLCPHNCIMQIICSTCSITQVPMRTKVQYCDMCVVFFLYFLSVCKFVFTSEKRLRVEKTRQPDDTGQRQVLSPAVQLFTTLQHVVVPDTQKDLLVYI